MITPFDVYWIMQLDHINLSLGLIIGILSLIVVVLMIGGDAIKDEKIKKRCWRVVCTSLLFIIILFIFEIFSPTTKTAMEMYVIPKLGNSALVQNIPAYVQQYIEKELTDNSKDNEDEK